MCFLVTFVESWFNAGRFEMKPILKSFTQRYDRSFDGVIVVVS